MHFHSKLKFYLLHLMLSKKVSLLFLSIYISVTIITHFSFISLYLSFCVPIVYRFAQLTGDAKTLSVTDVQILALTYQLEKQYNGMNFIKTEPVSINLIIYFSENT